MKKLLCMVTAILVIAVASLAGEDVTGFRGLQWGSAVPDTGMTKTTIKDDSYGGVDKYTRDSDVLAIGGADVSSIVYTYWRNQLLSVSIPFSGYNSYSILVDALRERYGGRVKRSSSYSKDYLILGTAGSGMLKYNEYSEEGVLLLFSTEVHNRADAYDKERARQGAKKDF